MFNYLVDYFQLPAGGGIFDDPEEHVQLPWGMFSIPMVSIFNYPREYVRLH